MRGFIVSPPFMVQLLKPWCIDVSRSQFITSNDSSTHLCIRLCVSNSSRVSPLVYAPLPVLRSTTEGLAIQRYILYIWGLPTDILLLSVMRALCRAPLSSLGAPVRIHRLKPKHITIIPGAHYHRWQIQLWGPSISLVIGSILVDAPPSPPRFHPKFFYLIGV